MFVVAAWHRHEQGWKDQLGGIQAYDDLFWGGSWCLCAHTGSELLLLQIHVIQKCHHHFVFPSMVYALSSQPRYKIFIFLALNNRSIFSQISLLHLESAVTHSFLFLSTISPVFLFLLSRPFQTFFPNSPPTCSYKFRTRNSNKIPYTLLFGTEG